MFAAILSLVLKIYNVLLGPITSQLALIESQTSTISPTGSVIKSIQTSSFTALPGLGSNGGSGNPTSGSVTITSVNPAKAYVVYQGLSCTSAGNETFLVQGSAQLASATSVSCTVNAAGFATGSVTIFFTVVEYN